jgi:hypothetical protein
VISYDVGFNPSTQRHYHRLIYYLYIHTYMFRSYDHHQVEKYITTLGQRIRSFVRSHITVIVYIMLRIVDTPLLWATFFLRCVPSVYRYGTEANLLMWPGLQPECGFSSWLFFWLRCTTHNPTRSWDTAQQSTAKTKYTHRGGINAAPQPKEQPTGESTLRLQARPH